MYDWYSVQIPSANAHAELRTVMLSPMHFGWPQTRPRLYTLGIRKGAKVMLQTHPCAAIAGDWNLQNPLNKVIDLWATPNFEAAEFFAANKDGCERTHLHTTITRRQKPTGLQALRPSFGLSFNNFDLNSRLPTQLNPNSSPWPSPGSCPLQEQVEAERRAAAARTYKDPHSGFEMLLTGLFGIAVKLGRNVAAQSGVLRVPVPAL